MNLKINNLSAEIDGKNILKNINLYIIPGKIHALMGPNGSGKSTFAQVLMGHPVYKVVNVKKLKSGVYLNGTNLLEKSPDERGRLGLFLAFQSPVSVPGVSVANLLRLSYSVIHNKGKKGKKGLHNPALSVLEFNELLFKTAQKLHIPADFLKRSLNEEFSGGEKKKLEMLQAVILSPKFAVFDEIDTGLDVDALKIVAQGINTLKKRGAGILLITHYQRILKYAKPDYVHILVNGKIVKEGTARLAHEVEENGYKKWLNN